MSESELNPQPIPPGRTVRVQVPGGILNDLEQFQKVQASILGRSGCPTCTSGRQFLWEEYENWVVDELGGVHGVAPGSIVSSGREG